MALDTFNPYLFVSAGEQSNKYLTPTITNGIAQFQAQRAQSLTGLTVRIDPIQEGSGDPSPENIRPISGHTGLTVTVQSGDTQNTYPITWQTEAGEVYGGTLDVVSGVLTVDKGFITLDGTQTIANRNWRPTAGSVGWLYPYAMTQNVVPASSAEVPAITSNRMKAASYSAVFNGTENNGIGLVYDTSKTYGLAVRYADTSLTTDAAINAFLAENPIQVVFPLETPQTYQLTPTDVKTLAGFNQIYSDAGPVIDIQF